MAATENETSRLELQRRLADLDVRFTDEMRKRGFDPAQAENLALPSALARLFTERLEIMDELAELVTDDQTGE
jgi:hypothetical protein